MRAAAKLLSADGVDAVQFAAVAAEAGVTRQLVYKFFPGRRALVMAVLDAFAADLERRFGERAARGLPESVAEATRVFVEAVCDTIEAQGVGAWRLLAGKGPDAEVTRLAHAIEARLLAPWHGRIAAATGASEREVATLAAMIVAAARAVLDQWHAGAVSRAEAVRDAARGVAAMLGAFSRR